MTYGLKLLVKYLLILPNFFGLIIKQKPTPQLKVLSISLSDIPFLWSHLKILDGFICTAAAACLEATVSGSLDHCVAGHESNEQAHKELLKRLNKKPLLSLGMRLGEGSGAAMAIGVLKAAIACHSGMATFAEAGVSED